MNEQKSAFIPLTQIGPQGLVLAQIDALEHLTERLEALLAKIAEQQGSGYSLTHSLSLTTTVTELDYSSTPAMSLVLANDGSGQAQLRVNDLALSLPVLVSNGEALSIDYRKHVIGEVFLRTTSGTASVRLTLTW